MPAKQTHPTVGVRDLAVVACGTAEVVVVLQVAHLELPDHLAVARVVLTVLSDCTAGQSLAPLKHLRSVLTTARVPCWLVRAVPDTAEDPRPETTPATRGCALGPLADLPHTPAEVAEALLPILGPRRRVALFLIHGSVIGEPTAHWPPLDGSAQSQATSLRALRPWARHPAGTAVGTTALENHWGLHASIHAQRTVHSSRDIVQANHALRCTHLKASSSTGLGAERPRSGLPLELEAVSVATPQHVAVVHQCIIVVLRGPALGLHLAAPAAATSANTPAEPLVEVREQRLDAGNGGTRMVACSSRPHRRVLQCALDLMDSLVVTDLSPFLVCHIVDAVDESREIDSF